MRFFKRNKLQTAFNIWYSVWKTTFKTIYQLSCFVRHCIWWRTVQSYTQDHLGCNFSSRVYYLITSFFVKTRNFKTKFHAFIQFLLNMTVARWLTGHLRLACISTKSHSFFPVPNNLLCGIPILNNFIFNSVDGSRFWKYSLKLLQILLMF